MLGSELWEDDFSTLMSIVKADVWENPNCMVKMCVLTPSLTPRGEILVRMVSCGW